MKMQQNQHGFGIVGVLIAIGLVAALGLAVATMIDQLAQATSGIEEKLAILDLQRTLTSLSTGKNLCKKAFEDAPGTFTYDTAGFPPAASIKIPYLYLNDTDTVALVEKDTYLPGKPGLAAQEVNLRNISGSGTAYSADLEIIFNGRSIASRRPLLTKVLVSGTLSAGKITLTACTASVATGTPDNQTSCEALGGEWVTSSPEFCKLPGDVLEWY